jgi:glycosyltransferase involved in cell wall biosynthesis
MMSNKPLISVVIIFLNAEEFIQEAIESVFAQTYDNWELLLVDDGSTDGSTNIAWQCAEQYSGKVRYLEHDGHQNRGMSASRNLGIREATGEYMAFLDADDIYLPQKLERQVVILDSYPTAAMVYGATQHWHSWTGKSEDLHRDHRRKLGVPPDTLVQPPTLPILFLQDKAQTPGTCGVLVRREAIERVGGFEENFRGMFEDQVFFYKLCLSAPVFVESGSWDRYRQHPNSHCEVSRVIGTYDPKGRLNPTYGAFLNWLEAYLTEQRITDGELWKALRAGLWPYHHPILYKVSHLATQTEGLLKRIVRRTLPTPVRCWLRAHYSKATPCALKTFIDRSL